MMTYEMMVAAIEALGEDASYYEYDGVLHVTFEDFEGFDGSSWEEISREYDDVDAVVDFETMLEAECISFECDFHVTYHFDGFDVELGYASDDI
jgi:hypothetical protein